MICILFRKTYSTRKKLFAKVNFSLVSQKDPVKIVQISSSYQESILMYSCIL